MTPTEEGTHDPLALELARRLHSRHGAIATVLFGSRATGRHDTELSDVDVLLITEEEYSLGDTAEAEQEALAIYKRPVKVQLQFRTPGTVAREADYADTVAGNALAHGLFAAGDPERFPSPYRGPDPAPPRYNFQAYQNALSWSGLLLRCMTIYHTGHIPDAETNPVLVNAHLMYYNYAHEPDTIYRRILQDAQAAAGHVTDCALMAAGVFPSHRQTITQPLQAATPLYPEGTTVLTIPQEAYQDPDSLQEMTQLEFMDAVHPELSRLREAAKTMRRRTGNRTNRSRREWERARGQQPATP